MKTVSELMEQVQALSDEVLMLRVRQGDLVEINERSFDLRLKIMLNIEAALEIEPRSTELLELHECMVPLVQGAYDRWQLSRFPSDPDMLD